MQLQTLVSRNNNPADPVVLTFGEIHGGTAPNIIPNTVTLRGTLRTLDNQVRRRHLEAIARIGEDFCRTFGGSCTAAVELGVPPLVNDPESCRLLHRAADRVLGPDCVETGRAPVHGVGRLLLPAGGVQKPGSAVPAGHRPGGASPERPGAPCGGEHLPRRGAAPGDCPADPVRSGRLSPNR